MFDAYLRLPPLMLRHSFLSPACAFNTRAHCGGGRSCGCAAPRADTRAHVHVPRMAPRPFLRHSDAHVFRTILWRTVRQLSLA